MLNLRKIWTLLGLVALVSLAACSSAARGDVVGRALATTQPVAAPTSTGAGSQAAEPAPAQAAATVSAPAAEAAAQTATAVPPAAAAATPIAQGAALAAPTTAAAALPAPAACTPGAITPAQTEGPYYKQNPPERSDLLQAGMAGTKLTVTGYVFTSDCKPVAGARVDFWQADSQGQYDNTGYTLRGYQVTDADGRYTVETVVPGLYPGRTRHIHVKVQAPGQPVLTTQLYFPGEAANNRDGIFNGALILNMQDTAQGKVGTFNFVLNVK